MPLSQPRQPADDVGPVSLLMWRSRPRPIDERQSIAATKGTAARRHRAASQAPTRSSGGEGDGRRRGRTGRCSPVTCVACDGIPSLAARRWPLDTWKPHVAAPIGCLRVGRHTPRHDAGTDSSWLLPRVLSGLEYAEHVEQLTPRCSEPCHRSRAWRSLVAVGLRRLPLTRRASRCSTTRRVGQHH